jgi:hypothetical protein
MKYLEELAIDPAFWILDFGFWILDFGFWIDDPVDEIIEYVNKSVARRFPAYVFHQARSIFDYREA